MMRYKKLFIIFILGILFTLSRYALAAEIFDLSYSLTEGGYRLELSPTSLYKGVRIEVNTDVASRYEVVQQIIKPLENRDDPGLIIEDNFVFHGLQGTNRLGNLRVPPTDMPVRANEILYTSNANGDADSFTLVYGLDRIEEIEPGEYFGRISFTLNPISSSRSSVTKILEIHVNISREAEAKPSIEITTATGSKQINLSTRAEGKDSIDILIKINTSFKKPFSIIQTLSGPLESQEGERLKEGAVNFLVRDVEKGSGINQLTPLSTQPQTIYTSAANGESGNYFLVTCSLADLSKEKAGKYRTHIQYLLDEIGVQTKLETLQLEVENERVFDLLIKPQDEKYSIEFLNLKPKDPPRKDEVTIEIKTNILKPYQVSQNVYSDLTNTEGKTIPPEYFTFRTESLDTKGNLKFPQKTQVKKGETILYASDEAGSADKFKVIFELQCPEGSPAGDYSSRVTYSLLEM